MPAGGSPPRTLRGGPAPLRSQPSAGRLWSYLSQTQFVSEPHEELSNIPEFLLLAETLRKTECSHSPREKSNFSTWLLRSTVRREIQFGAILHRIFRKTRSQTDRKPRQNEETPMEPTVACSEQAPAGRPAQPAALPAPRNPIGFPHPRSPSPRCLRPTPHAAFSERDTTSALSCRWKSPISPKLRQDRRGVPDEGRAKPGSPAGARGPSAPADARRSRSVRTVREEDARSGAALSAMPGPGALPPLRRGSPPGPGRRCPRDARHGAGGGCGAVRAAGALRRDSGETPVAAAGCVTRRRAEPGLPALHRRAPPPAPLPPAAARTATRGARPRPALTGRDGTGRGRAGQGRAARRRIAARVRPAESGSVLPGGAEVRRGRGPARTARGTHGERTGALRPPSPAGHSSAPPDPAGFRHRVHAPNKLLFDVISHSAP